ncbi:MAG: prolipoprotein diacylglyceryl transferase [Candidatus Portnoybacteria bacterium]|nr:prolipoprotein diacylglyceryl transferase [Candidatus Portnoybacteria bacterium]
MIPYFIFDSFQIGPLKFYSWGVFIALAFLVGLILSLKQGKKVGVGAQKTFNLIIFVYLGAIIGARLFYVLQWPSEFLKNPLEFFKFGDGGLMFYGGLFGGAMAGWLYLRRIKVQAKSPLAPPRIKYEAGSKGGELLPPSREGWGGFFLLDALAPIVPLCMAIGRIGCLLINDHLGAITSLPWAIQWPDGYLRHPVALYLILFDLALAGFLWWRRKRTLCLPSSAEEGVGGGVEKNQHPTLILPSSEGRRGIFYISQFFLFLILYPLGRFLLDFTRDIDADPHYWGLAVSQWISLFFLTYFLCRQKVCRFFSSKKAAEKTAPRA